MTWCGGQLAAVANIMMGMLLTLLPLVAATEVSYGLAHASDSLIVNITQKRTSTSSIVITWDLAPGDEITIEEYHIRYRKEDSAAITLTPAILNNATEYEVQHLMTNSMYDICLIATRTQSNGSKKYEQSCVDFKTIPTIRADSLLALLFTIAYVIVTILVAYYIWRKRKREYDDEKYQAALERKSATSGDSNLEKADMANQSNYLLPPDEKKRQRLSIEDPDIPYITPPVSEVNDTESEATVDYRENYRETSLVRT